MSDTPETDNLARGNHVVPTEWAEQLERQLRKCRAIVHRLRMQRAIARKFGEQMERERDEARQQLAELGESTPQDNSTRHCGRVEKTEQDFQQ